jgi:BTB/POZ domain
LRHTLMSKEAIIVEMEELSEKFKCLVLEHEKILSSNKLLRAENSILTSSNCSLKKYESGAPGDMQLAIQNEKLKDFTIIVDNFEFKVHKFLLMARSPVIAEMIVKNPDASMLQLLDISKPTFEEVLKFIYDDTLPTNIDITRDIFIISGRLKIEKLKNFAARKLINQVDEKNSFEMLVLANMYKHHGLRLRAFEELKKLFPEVELKQELAKEPEKVRMLLDTKHKWEKMTEYIEEKYKKVC